MKNKLCTCGVLDLAACKKLTGTVEPKKKKNTTEELH